MSSSMNMDTNPIRVLIADPSSKCLHSLERLLRSETGFDVVGETREANAVLELMTSIKPDVLLIDFAMSQDISRAGQTIHVDKSSRPRVIVMVPTIEKTSLLETLRLGARGILARTSS